MGKRGRGRSCDVRMEIAAGPDGESIVLLGVDIAILLHPRRNLNSHQRERLRELRADVGDRRQPAIVSCRPAPR